jgi:hypothetical protein
MAIIQLTEKHRERLKEYGAFLSDTDRFNQNEIQYYFIIVNLLETILDDNQYDDDELILADVGLNYDYRIIQTCSSLLNKLEKFYMLESKRM